MSIPYYQRYNCIYSSFANVTDTMKYRWASCTPKGNVNFNWRIIKAPIFVIEYLIVHELAICEFLTIHMNFGILYQYKFHHTKMQRYGFEIMEIF